jgi:hypothetical protein
MLPVCSDLSTQDKSVLQGAAHFYVTLHEPHLKVFLLPLQFERAGCCLNQACL